MLGYREALELFRYDYETGVLYWRWRVNNRVRNNNRLFNLRFVTRSENRKNQSVSSKNTSGVTGVYFSKAKKKYIAQIKVNREVIYLGIFETLECAAEARRQADRKYKFNNNHGEGRAEYVRKKANARLSK